MVSAWLSALSQGHLDKAMRTGSAAFDIALTCLATALYDGYASSSPSPPGGRGRRAGGVGAAVGGGGGGGGGGAPSDSDKVESRRQALALQVLQRVEPPVLKKMVQVRGVPYVSPLENGEGKTS